MMPASGATTAPKIRNIRPSAWITGVTIPAITCMSGTNACVSGLIAWMNVSMMPVRMLMPSAKPAVRDRIEKITAMTAPNGPPAANPCAAVFTSCPASPMFWTRLSAAATNPLPTSGAANPSMTCCRLASFAASISCMSADTLRPLLARKLCLNWSSWISAIFFAALAAFSAASFCSAVALVVFFSSAENSPAFSPAAAA